MPELRLRLPLPPSANRYHRIYQGRAVLSAEARQYVEQVGWTLAGQPRPAPKTPLYLTVRAYCQIARDLDNTAKVLVDSLARALEWDDKYLTQLVLTKVLTPKTEERHVEVTLRWGEDCPTLWHCAWCDPLPERRATSGICQQHLAALRREHAGA